MGYLCANFSLPLSFLDLEPMYATDRQTDRRQTDRRQTSDAHRRLMPPRRGHNNMSAHYTILTYTPQQ